MIGKLVLVLLLAGTIKARSQSSIQSSGDHQEDFYNGPFLPNGCPTDFTVSWLLRHDTFCNKFFQCISGRLDERTCMPNTFFNYFARPGPACDWLHNVDCGDLRPALSAEPKSTGKVLPSGCPADFAVHQLLPHETYCDKFYYCVFGEKVESDCGPGTFFNPDAYPGPVCDWPDKVDCDGRTTSPAPTGSTPTDSTPTDSTTMDSTTTSSTTTSSTTTVSTTTDSTERPPSECPADFSVHKLLPHETYCDKFYYCVFGEKVERDCPAGTVFNPDAYPGPVCDWPDKVDCDGRTTSPAPTGSTPTDSTPTDSTPTDSTTTSSTTTSSTTTVSTTTDSTERPPSECPTDFSVHKLLPHETYCDKFYYCVFGEKVERDCPAGTVFNPDAYPGPVCDWPDKVDCGDRKTSPATTGSTPTDTTPTDSTTTDSTTTSSTTTVSTTTDSTERPPSECPADFSVHKLLPHETYCDKFYYCVFGEKVERDCPAGTVFNPDAYPGPVCDWPDKVDCGDRKTSPATTGSTPTDTTPTDSTTTDSTTTSSTTTVSTTTDSTERPPSECPTDFSVHKLLPHETYCNKFYYCVFGEKVERDCPSGTYFNPDAYPGPVCDWPDRVDCSRRT